MIGYLAALTLVLMIGMVSSRVFIMRAQGVGAMKFGQIDRRDFFILPFALVYFGIVLAAAFAPGAVSSLKLFHSASLSWLGVMLCAAGLALLLWSLVSFGRSFRVGIDADNPDRLITTGAFAYSRNPIYVAFTFILVGEFLVFANFVLLAYIFAGVWLFDRQVRLEEGYLKRRYGQDYARYCEQVRRYL
jgi:protein-S-isoprenylcysteine O-methyltransferase Ste14